MPHRPMTVGAARRALLDVAVTGDVLDRRTMALDAVMLQRQEIATPDADRLAEVLQREFLGMVPAVVHLHQVFLREGMRHMAVVAGRPRLINRKSTRLNSSHSSIS